MFLRSDVRLQLIVRPKNDCVTPCFLIVFQSVGVRRMLIPRRGRIGDDQVKVRVERAEEDNNKDNEEKTELLC